MPEPAMTTVAAAASEAAEALQKLLEAFAQVQMAPAEGWRLLSLPDAAERLGRSERWVRERVHRRELAVVRLDGGALGFLVDDLIAHAHAHRIQAHP